MRRMRAQPPENLHNMFHLCTNLFVFVRARPTNIQLIVTASLALRCRHFGSSIVGVMSVTPSLTTTKICVLFMLKIVIVTISMKVVMVETTTPTAVMVIITISATVHLVLVLLECIVTGIRLATATVLIVFAFFLSTTVHFCIIIDFTSAFLFLQLFLFNLQVKKKLVLRFETLRET